MKRRNTPTKEAVLKLLAQSGKALSHEAIEKAIDIPINRATIYRVLNQFCHDGTVHKIVAEDGKQYFAVCMKCEGDAPQEPHFHFRCTSCDSIECLKEPVHFSLPEGYEVASVNCVLSGLCSKCSSHNSTCENE
ncbi:Fur family transcriptional regulator [Sunxiuqinia elliptica]|uniref:Fur family transcriptional regulator, ferric uptake regulator n=1 Tax=Sunxiuqinia elliptica TaxID=655355 RepID=A0A1I2IHP5_9BACT|nr:transcriptional repressor [Sunxiuqinia elliptica]SFF41160.1 Fur family transcriptional regulator, ferric uptake regulator [Sunxiuqinia elliptica]